MVSKVTMSLEAEYWPVSSKLGTNVNELFLRMVTLTFDISVIREIESKAEKIAIGEIPTFRKLSKFI